MEVIQNDCDEFDWQDAFDVWSATVLPMLDAAPSNVFVVEGLPLWNRSVGGAFRFDGARSDFALALLRLVTVKSEWTLRYRATAEGLDLRLAHHDVPTGRSFTCRPMTRDELDKLEATGADWDVPTFNR